jgi:hypothetical protein
VKRPEAVPAWRSRSARVDRPFGPGRGARHRVTVFGAGPQYLLGTAKYGIDPSAHSSRSCPR